MAKSDELDQSVKSGWMDRIGLITRRSGPISVAINHGGLAMGHLRAIWAWIEIGKPFMVRDGQRGLALATEGDGYDRVVDSTISSC
jgi:hypothetical protein